MDFTERTTQRQVNRVTASFINGSNIHRGTRMNYKSFEKYCAYQDEKRELLQKYNTENGTLYHFYFECIRKEYIGGTTSTELGKAFDVSPTGIRLQLQKMGVPLEPLGGNKKPLLTVIQIREIRESKDSNTVLSKRYGYDVGGIWHIKNGTRWANVR